MTRLAALKARLGGGRSLPVDITSPYFAHIRLKESGKIERRAGRQARLHRSLSRNVQIVDWRNAPMSRIYYRYEEGDDYEEEIAGRRVEGMVEARRNVSIAKRQPAPDRHAAGHVPEGRARQLGPGGRADRRRCSTAAWARRRARSRAETAARRASSASTTALARADKALPEIAALIDKEQFELITQPGSGIVVIQGGAGSGKTTVALHRVAYLNFQDGRRFKPQNTLFVVPTQSLVRYVGGVLPALGVAGVPVVTYTGWARTTRMRCLPDAPTKYNADPPDQVSRVKKHPALLGMLERCGRAAGRADRRASSARAVRGAGARGVEPAGHARARCRGCRASIAG